jgi:hypothetical protein
MLLGKEAESEASVGGKPRIRVSLQEYPTGLVPWGGGGDSGADRKLNKRICSYSSKIFIAMPFYLCYFFRYFF